MNDTGHKPAVKLRDPSFPSLLCGNPRDQPGPGCTGRGGRRGAASRHSIDELHAAHFERNPDAAPRIMPFIQSLMPECVSASDCSQPGLSTNPLEADSRQGHFWCNQASAGSRGRIFSLRCGSGGVAICRKAATPDRAWVSGGSCATTTEDRTKRTQSNRSRALSLMSAPRVNSGTQRLLSWPECGRTCSLGNKLVNAFQSELKQWDWTPKRAERAAYS